jgi:Ulp1 family protease
MKHWTLYVICNPTEANPTGSILFMDSMRTGVASKRVVRLLRKWLKARASWESRRAAEAGRVAAADSFDASKHTYQLIVCTVPQQPNHVDCGLFVACNIDAFEKSRAAGNDGKTVRLRARYASARGVRTVATRQFIVGVIACQCPFPRDSGRAAACLK